MASGFLTTCSHGGASEATTGIEVELNFSTVTTGKGIQVDLDALTSGTGFEFRVDSDIHTGKVIDIKSGSTIAAATSKFYVKADGTIGIGGTALGATAAELNNAADVSGRVQELTVTGAVTAGMQSVELNHTTVIAAATIADSSNHQGLFVVKDTSASGTAAHTLTLTAGTFDGTNNKATLNAPKECLVVYFDSAGAGTIMENVGSVALASV